MSPGSPSTAASTIANRSAAGEITRLPVFCQGSFATTQQDPIEPEGVPGFGRGHEMADMGRIERPAEDSQSLTRSAHRRSVVARWVGVGPQNSPTDGI